jgi:RNA polymerase sigma factor (sigma-70 family)
MRIPEEELVQLFQKKDPDAFRKLYGQYAAKMMAVCVRYMGDTDKAKDVLQDGFIKVLRHIHEFRAEGSLEGWIRRIIVNTALLALRQDKLRFAVGPEEVEFELHTSFDEALDRLSVKELLTMISNLPPGYRTVFNLFVMEGYSHKEIAAELNINESTSRSQLTKARNMLQEMILKQRSTISLTLPTA